MAEANPVAPALAGRDIQLKIEHAKIPEFYGQAGKDNITAQHVIYRVDDLMGANGWSEKVAFKHFSLSLRGSANEWLRTLMHLHPNYTENWTWVKPLFRKEFALEQDDKALLDQFAQISMKSTENVRDYLSRLDRMMTMMEDSYQAPATIASPADQDPANRIYTANDMVNQTIATYKDAFKFILLHMFRSGLPQSLKTAVSQKDPKNIMDAYTVANTQFKLEQDKVSKIQEVSTPSEEVDAIRPQPQQPFRQNNFRPQRPNNWNNRTGGTGQATGANGYGNGNANRSGYQGNNSYRNKQICVYCKIPGHRQEDCRRRISDNKPCLTAAGKPYWPKKVSEINNEGHISDIISQQDQGFQFRA